MKKDKKLSEKQMGNITGGAGSKPEQVEGRGRIGGAGASQSQIGNKPTTGRDPAAGIGTKSPNKPTWDKP